MSTPALSVAMSVYDGERFLQQAAESVLAQDFGDFEFLILDDGSTDSTPRIIRDLAERDSRIRPILRENHGLIASLNELLQAARAPLVARMDADDVCEPQRFGRQVAFLRANPDYGVVGSRTHEMDERGRPWTGMVNELPLTHEDAMAAIAERRVVICHPAAMYRRDLVLSVGGYHAAYRHCEDLDLWLRLASVTKIGNVPERLLHYRHYAGQVSRRHVAEQAYGAAVARFAFAERAAGRPDPTERLTELPPLAGLDSLFGRPGISREVARTMARGLLYSREALLSEAFESVILLAREEDARAELWRTVARLLQFGAPRRAARLALALLRTN